MNAAAAEVYALGFADWRCWRGTSVGMPADAWAAWEHLYRGWEPTAADRSVLLDAGLIRRWLRERVH